MKVNGIVGNNALLNISFDLLVSQRIFIYTNLRDSNIAYYSDVIPLFKKDIMICTLHIFSLTLRFRVFLCCLWNYYNSKIDCISYFKGEES